MGWASVRSFSLVVSLGVGLTGHTIAPSSTLLYCPDPRHQDGTGWFRAKRFAPSHPWVFQLNTVQQRLPYHVYRSIAH